MSFRVVAKVLDESDERLARRLILIVLAETAHDDGIVFLGQEEIAHKARLSRSHVAEELVRMVGDGVLELRKAQRGRKRINVYRIVLDGLLDPRYDRLPFALDDPFTTSEVPTRSESDGVGSTGSTTSDLARKSPASPLVEPPIGTTLSSRVPAKVDRKATTKVERDLSAAVLEEWNRQTGQKLTSGDWLAKVVMRIREYPDLTVGDHAAVIAASLASPWWKGDPSPSVVYGNGAIFEKSLACRDRAPAAATPGRYGRGLTTRQTADLFGLGSDA